MASKNNPENRTKDDAPKKNMTLVVRHGRRNTLGQVVEGRRIVDKSGKLICEYGS